MEQDNNKQQSASQDKTDPNKAPTKETQPSGDPGRTPTKAEGDRESQLEKERRGEE
jgi:hypothetical protein